jgi:hypothetical protein
MADITKLQDIELMQIGTPDTPIIRLAEPSAAGSTNLKFDSPIYQGDDATAVTKAIYLAIQRTTDKKILVVYVPASGFTDAYNATNVVRGLKRSGIDASAVDVDYDIDLPSGSQVIGVISQFHVLQLMSWAFGDIASGGTELVIGDETASTMTFSVKDNVGKKGLIRRNIAGYAEYSNDGTTWVRVDTAAPANVTTRTAAPADANNGELYQNTSDSNSLYFKDNGGSSVKIIDDNTQKIPQYSLQKLYAADSQANDTYVITLDQVPANLAALEGRTLTFKANTANTGACTLNVNTLGAKAIKKFDDQDTETGDIEAGMIVQVQYDATDDVFKMLNPPASQMSVATQTDLTDGGSTILHTHTTIKAVASDTLKQSADTERSTTSNSYVGVKDILIDNIQAGLSSIRIKFDLKNGGSSYNAYGRVYINGVDVGTERSTNSTTYVTFSEDFSVKNGDRIYLFIKEQTASPNTAYAKNFRLYYDLTTTTETTVVTD